MTDTARSGIRDLARGAGSHGALSACPSRTEPRTRRSSITSVRAARLPSEGLGNDEIGRSGTGAAAVRRASRWASAAPAL